MGNIWSGVFLKKIVTGSCQHRHQFVVCCVTDLPQGEPNLPVIYKRRLLVVFTHVRFTAQPQNKILSMFQGPINLYILVVSFPLMTNNIVQFFES